MITVCCVGVKKDERVTTNILSMLTFSVHTEKYKDISEEMTVIYDFVFDTCYVPPFPPCVLLNIGLLLTINAHFDGTATPPVDRRQRLM